MPQNHYFEQIRQIDIIDANAGDHGYPFATNFNPKSISGSDGNGRYYENGQWVETPPLSIRKTYDLLKSERRTLIAVPEGTGTLARNAGDERIRFWMTFPTAN